MSQSPAQLVTPIATRRTVWWLIPVGLVFAVALAVLWWVDPRQWHLSLCVLHAATGWHCPGCGATRATHDLLHGRLLLAIQNNAFWILALPGIFYTLASEVRCSVLGRPLPGNPARRPWLLVAVAVGAVLFGVLRNIPVYPLMLLAPPG